MFNVSHNIFYWFLHIDELPAGTCFSEMRSTRPGARILSSPNEHPTKDDNRAQTSRMNPEIQLWLIDRQGQTTWCMLKMQEYSKS